jgi:LacI family transcriptional regulator
VLVRRVSIRQVAESAGVSMSTVSNVFNNPQLVSPETRQRVEDAMVATGYVRNGAARQLRGAPSTMVGCLLLDSANPFFAEVSRGMEDRLAEAGCMAVVCSTDVRAERESRYLQMLEEVGVRGVLLFPVGSRLDAAVALDRRGTPVVLVDHSRAGAQLCAVAVDNAHGGDLVARHLVGLSHRRIAVVRAQSDVPSLVSRLDGLRRGLAAAGLELSTALLDVPVSPQAGVDEAEAAVPRVLAAMPQPTAVVGFNDIVAVGVMRGLRTAGVDIPGQMSVLGYDDLAFASQLSPALTTVRQPTYQLGRAAAELLLAEELPGHRHREVLFTPELVVRGSTAAPRG